MLALSCSTPVWLIPFFTALLVQINDPNSSTHGDYELSPDFMTNEGIKFDGKKQKTIPSACEAGPAGKLPKFDFIVAGGGPASALIANQLAEKFCHKTTLLIEAGGGDAIVNTVVPALTSYTQKSEASVAYFIEPQDNFGLGVKDNKPFVVIGKGLGGGSSNSEMTFNCGNENNYNLWANLTKDPSWKYENMLKIFQKITKIDDETLKNDPECSKVYGSTGPVTLSPFKSQNGEIPILKEALNEAGYDMLKDINCGKWIGYYNPSRTIKNGERNAAAGAFLATAKDKKNLMILKGATIDKLLMKRTSSSSSGSSEVSVTGVRVKTANSKCKHFDIKARREIILGAGTFNTPRILMRSGIGRKSALKPLGIKQTLNLPVGENYRDNVYSTHYIVISKPQEVADPNAPPAADPYDLYLFNRTGPLAQFSANDLNVLINTKKDSPYPDIEWDTSLVEAEKFDAKAVSEAVGYKEELLSSVVEDNKKNAIIILKNLLLQPKSSGMIQMTSTNSSDPPKIVGNYLSDPEDVKTMIGGIRMVEELINTPYMKSMNAKLSQMNIPECNALTYDTDDYWTCYLKYFASVSNNPIGTCKMGRSHHKASVVNSRLKVIGISGYPRLRIADKSIMPQLTSGDTACAYYAIGLKAADLIARDN